MGRCSIGRRVLLIGCVLLFVLTGCSSWSGQPVTPSSEPAAADPSSTEAQAGTTASVTGLPAGQQAQITNTGPAPVPPVGQPPGPTPGPVTSPTHGGAPAGLAFFSDVYSIGPSGPLATPAHVRLPLHTAASNNTAVFGATREDPSQPWQYLPATLAPDGRSVAFDTTHFSFFTVVGYNLNQVAQEFKDDFIDGLDAGATQNDIPRPTCPDEQGARSDGYRITSSTTDTVYWCLGRDAGRRMLKVANHRRYPLQILHPELPNLTNPHDYLAFPALSRFGSGPYTILAPGVTATFNAELPPGHTGRIQTELDGVGQSLYALQTGVESLVAILTRFGAGSDIEAVEAVDRLLQTRSCADSLDKGGGAVVAGCFTPTQLIAALGAKAVLIVPLMIFGPVLSFLRSEWNTLVDQFNHHDQYRIVIQHAQPTVTLAAFAGDWTGHTRSLSISPSGVGKESVDDGCCSRVFDLTFQLSALQGSSPAHATATATITTVTVGPGWDASLGKPPAVGDRGTVSVDGGVITDHLVDVFYCNAAEDEKGTCGL